MKTTTVNRIAAAVIVLTLAACAGLGMAGWTYLATDSILYAVALGVAVFASSARAA